MDCTLDNNTSMSHFLSIVIVSAHVEERPVLRIHVSVTQE